MAALVFMACGASARADVPAKSIQSIEDYLNTDSAAKLVLNFVHMGADYRGHQLLGAYDVVGKPDMFIVTYRYWWATDGMTDVDFVCDSSGSVRAVQIADTNAVFNQPFVVAQASLQLLSQVVVNTADLTPSQRAAWQRLVDAEDVRGMLVFLLP
jgi:hypothetical protein